MNPQHWGSKIGADHCKPFSNRLCIFFMHNEYKKRKTVFPQVFEALTNKIETTQNQTRSIDLERKRRSVSR